MLISKNMLRSIVEQEEKYVSTIKNKAKKIKSWLKDNEDKPGKTGKPIKSSITDNESAKIKTSHGVIQGYNGVAVVDEKHQVIVHAEHALQSGFPHEQPSAHRHLRSPFHPALQSRALSA